ncbi:unnamed protein product [Vitrella brassicaformis CCMP3155]|uniref:Pyruvate kinase n=2 Tax=Vitrella brassicaformis TaxID=1169539 RepID=A0A0G4EGA5_VITBC|nr:unnamed protein product [Vitrella brassicaformis CCMP3155]|eukprot:CEL94407.1 unnamed protein product [Vitrella brassicaformis CCMP3155]
MILLTTLISVMMVFICLTASPVAHAASTAPILQPPAFLTPLHPAGSSQSSLRRLRRNRSVPLPSIAMTSSVKEAGKDAHEAIVADRDRQAHSMGEHMRRFRIWKFTRTKQVATLGPATDTFDTIEALFLNGADVFRLNFSHGTHEEKAEFVRIIREIEKKWNHPIAILADLQGPKLRIGLFDKDPILVDGQHFRFDLQDDIGDAARVKLPHPEILETLRVGDVLLVDDGKLRMKVREAGGTYVSCTVEVGGKISSRKGVNTPTVVLPISAMSDKDRKDAVFAKSLGVDWIALSFVQRPEDIAELRQLVDGDVKLIAKVEKPSAVEKIEDIVKISDGIMVARGDLGVEMMPEDVPIIQKQIIDRCRREGRPVIVATQMLESMIDSPTPTRAEASDVATAIYDGADAVMLSGETAVGKYATETVNMQQRIIERVEGDPLYRKRIDAQVYDPARTATDAITVAARQVADLTRAKAIVVFTLGGTTVIRSSKGRPHIPVIAVTPKVKTARTLQLYWGVYPIVEEDTDTLEQSIDHMFEKGCEVARQEGICQSPDDLLVITAGLPFGTPGATNILRVCQAAGPNVWDVDSEQAHAGPPQQLRIEPLMEDSSEPDGTAFY